MKMNDMKNFWEEKLSNDNYFGCKEKYVVDLVERNTDKEIRNATLAATGVKAGIHQGDYREPFFDIEVEGNVTVREYCNVHGLWKA